MRIFDPAGAFGDDPANGPASLPPSAPAPVTVALDLTAGAPEVSLAQPGSALEAGATQWVLCLVSLQDLGSGFPVDPKQFAVSVAVTSVDPLPADFRPAEWEARSADPAGSYALLLVGPSGAVNPGLGRWRVYVQVQAGGETLIVRAPGCLTIE